MPRERGPAPRGEPVPGVRDSRCMGCADGVYILTHDCSGNRIPSAELGWRCVCPLPECHRRQAGEWPTNEPSGTTDHPSSFR